MEDRTRRIINSDDTGSYMGELMVRVRLKQTNEVKQYNKWLIELSIHDGKFCLSLKAISSARRALYIALMAAHVR